MHKQSQSQSAKLLVRMRMRMSLALCLPCRRVYAEHLPSVTDWIICTYSDKS